MSSNLKTHECIYCLRQLPAEEFNREHVLSNAFGAFSNGPVLSHCVCRGCNQFFGDQLEVRFARGAFEGLLRYQSGIRTPPKGDLKLRYVEFAMPEGHGDWSDVRLKLVNGEDGLRVSVIPQVAFFDKGLKKWVHVTEQEIDSGLFAKRPDFKKSQMRIHAPSLQEQESIVAKLAEHGINFKKEGDLHPPEGSLEAPEIEVDVTLSINRGIRRCIAKYSFNYLAHVCVSAFVCKRDFDVIRQFIRYGDAPPYPLVVAGSKPILHDDRPSARQTGGHLLTLNWTESLRDLVGQVSIFNSLTYSVSLCRQFSDGIWRPIRSGIHYDLGKNLVRPLAGFSKDLIP